MQMTEQPTLSGIAMISVYTEDFATSFAFYHTILGLKDFSPMGEHACYFRFGTASDGAPYGMYLVGKRAPAARPEERLSHATFAFDVPSVHTWFEHLKAHGIATDRDAPMDMGNDHFWFTAYDPSGVPIEFVGHR